MALAGALLRCPPCTASSAARQTIVKQSDLRRICLPAQLRSVMPEKRNVALGKAKLAKPAAGSRRPSSTNWQLLQQALNGRHYPRRFDFIETIVVPLGADAFVAKTAGHIVKQYPAFHPPRHMLRIGQRIQIDQRGADRSGHMGWPGIA